MLVLEKYGNIRPVKTTDKPFIALMSILFTIQMPLEGSILVVLPLFLFDFAQKNLKNLLDIDDTYSTIKP